MPLAPSVIESLLTELGELIVARDVAPASWLVCGGTAMGLQSLVSRPTKDVDVLAGWGSAGVELIDGTTFPEPLAECVRQVALLHPELDGLKGNWVNLGPAQLARHGLPTGFEARLVVRHFGPRLTLHLLSRQDLIPLKLYAASDDLRIRHAIHLDDLRRLAPTFDELDRALDWVRTHPGFEARKPALDNAFHHLGHGELSYYLD